MTDEPTPETIDKWHRRFAVECNNRTWDLIDKPKRTPAEDQEMLYNAYSAAFHWLKVGKPINNARADVTLAHVHALLGQGQLALGYAQRCLAFFENNTGEDWDMAFAHAEMAFAAAVLGDADLHAKHYAQAKKLGEAIQEEEDRTVFMDESSRIPSQVMSP